MTLNESGAGPAPDVPGLVIYRRRSAATGWALARCRHDGSRDSLGLIPDPPGECEAAVITTAELRAEDFDTLLVSWNARVPPGATLAVEARVRQTGQRARWLRLAYWTEGEERQSPVGEVDAEACVLTDTLSLTRPAQAWQVRVTLNPGAPRLAALPRLDCLAVQTRLRSSVGSPAQEASFSDAPRFLGRELVVPPISQNAFTGGGEGWCSPSSLTMLLRYWRDTLGSPGAAPLVPDVARGVFDRVYGGCGNWAFNVAYAGRGALRAYLALLPNLRAAEAFLAAGRPLAVSFAWREGQLPGAPLPSSRGHVVVLRGFAANGDVIVNDPAAPSELEVRRAYPREAFSRLWLEHSLGLAYILEPIEV